MITTETLPVKFKEDVQVKKKPTCAVPGCSNSALVLMAGKFICGPCCANFNMESNKMIFEQMKRINQKEVENDN